MSTGHRNSEAQAERAVANAEGLERARGIVEGDLCDAKEHCDADWIGTSQQALDAIDAVQAVLPELVTLGQAVENYRRAERECPANKASLGRKPCPTCGAASNESCRETVRAAYAVVDAAKSTLRIAA